MEEYKKVTISFTKDQLEKIDDLILSVVKHFPQSKKFLEYDDYYALPTRENANEFLDAVAERYADRADELKGLVNYISNRPSVEKLGSHGLFTQFDLPIDLDTVADRVAAHDGVIWTEVVSLRREDAERLHFNNVEAWKNLVRRNMNEIAQAHRIKVEDLEWYGAFHNTTHHTAFAINGDILDHSFCFGAVLNRSGTDICKSFFFKLCNSIFVIDFVIILLPSPN